MAWFRTSLFLMPMLVGFSSDGAAQEIACGAPPELPKVAVETEKFKEEIDAKAQTLARIAGGDLKIKADQEIKKFNESSPKISQAIKEAYFRYMLCSFISGNKEMSSREKFDIIQSLNQKSCQNTAIHLEGTSDSTFTNNKIAGFDCAIVDKNGKNNRYESNDIR